MVVLGGGGGFLCARYPCTAACRGGRVRPRPGARLSNPEKSVGWLLLVQKWRPWCKVTPVILHGVVSPEHPLVSFIPEGAHRWIIFARTVPAYGGDGKLMLSAERDALGDTTPHYCCTAFSWPELRPLHVTLHGLHSNSHGARPVHLIITMIKWIRTSRLSIKNSLTRAPARSAPPPHQAPARATPPPAAPGAPWRTPRTGKCARTLP